MDSSTNIIIETIGAGYIYPTPTTDNDYPDTHRRAEALIDINLQIRKGDFIALTGITGAGKSTLLYLLAGAIKPTSGQVIIDDVPFVTAIVELAEGPLMPTNIIMDDPTPEKLKIGMPLVVEFEHINDKIALPKFKPA